MPEKLTVLIPSRNERRNIRERIESMDVDPARTRHLKGRLLHYSFWSYDEYFEKYARYSRLSAEELRVQGKRASTYDLLVRPFLRFFHLYILKGGFLDGAAGIQVCMLMAFFYSFSKRARLWEMEYVEPQPTLKVYAPMQIPASPGRATAPFVKVLSKAA